MSPFRPPRATLIDREANGGPDVLPARVWPATILINGPATSQVADSSTLFGTTRMQLIPKERRSDWRPLMTHY